jgi:hypothetical protein
MTKEINTARAFGTAAFAQGVPATPCMDKNLMALMDGMEVGTGAAEIMKAWLAGWYQANLAAAW